MKAMFVRKAFGWGISPGNWRGWLVTGLYVLAMLAIVKFLSGTVEAVGGGALTLSFLAFAIWAFAKKI